MWRFCGWLSPCTYLLLTIGTWHLATQPHSKIAALLCLGVMALVTGLMVNDPSNLVSLFGMAVFLSISWAMSYKPREVKWGPVISGSKCPHFVHQSTALYSESSSRYLVFLFS